MTEISPGVTIHSINTARYIITFNGNEEYYIHFEQKISRKISTVILPALFEFFDEYPDYRKKYFEVYKHFLKNPTDKVQLAIYQTLREGFDLLDVWLQTHPDITGIKVPDGLRALFENKSIDILEPKTISHIAIYSWKIKLLSLFKYLKSVKVPKVEKKILQELSKRHLIDTGLDDIILNIVKGKIISTLNSRNEMWKYLEYSIRKSPELYISQLYSYTITYILLFMRNSYNPLGYTGDFIGRQILYIFNDVYLNDIVYHDIEEKHLKYKNLSYQVFVDDMTERMLSSVNNFYRPEAISKFQKSFRTTSLINEIITIPTLNIIFPIDTNPRAYYSFNMPIFNMYLSILFTSPLFKFKYIPKLLLSNSTKSTKVNYRRQQRDTLSLNHIYSLDIRNISVIQEKSELNNIASELSGYIYVNILADVVYDFNLSEFIAEYKVLLKILNDKDEIERINNILKDIDYEFKRKINDVEEHIIGAKQIQG